MIFDASESCGCTIGASVRGLWAGIGDLVNPYSARDKLMPFPAFRGIMCKIVEDNV